MRNEWANIDKHLVTKRWNYEYNEQRRVFSVHNDGEEICNTEYSEVAHAICESFNSRAASRSSSPGPEPLKELEDFLRTLRVTLDQQETLPSAQNQGVRAILDSGRTRLVRAEKALAALAASSPVARPKIVCLCGSTRFYQQFQRANYEETMAGNIVLSVGFYMHTSEEAHGEKWGCTDSQKIALDVLHKKKIDLADEVLVLNVGGYIGSSTRSEIEHAKATGKPIRYLEAAAVERLYRVEEEGR